MSEKREEENFDTENHKQLGKANSSPLISTSLKFSSVLSLALGWMMLYADRLSISPLLDMIKTEFGLSNFSVSLVVFSYFLAYVALTIPATIGAMRYGFKKTLITFFVLAAASLALAGVFGYSYFLLVILIGLHGAGAGAYYPAAYTISTETVPRDKVGSFSALINSGMAFGTVLGLVVAGPVLLFFSNWQIVLLILSVPTFVVALLLYRVTPDIGQGAQRNTKSWSALVLQYRKALAQRDFLMIALAMFCSLYGYWTILTWAPTFLQMSRKLDVLSSGATTAVFAAVAIMPSILISRHTDKIGRKKVSLTILPLAALSIFFMAYSTTLVEFLAAIVTYGIVGKLTLDPIAISWIGDITSPEMLSPSLAVLNVVAMSSSILAPVITGALADTFSSLAYGFYLGALVVLIGTIFIALARTRNQHSTR
ncbi:MAG: MFS transporter [Nitrososphaerota archaeon]|nr:MFS transporter [Nitrososphaerota archaeon]